MAKFPSEPIPAAEFFEDLVPALYAELELNEAERAVELEIGVVLRSEEGEQGGAWTMQFAGGQLTVQSARDDACEITLVLSVEDWRSALWEGRPGLIADVVQEVAESGGAGAAARPRSTSGSPDLLRGLTDIQGLVELIIAGAEGDAAADWRVGVLLGSGPIPESPQATILLGADQAEAIRRDELHPLEALITGQLRLEGDLGLILQLQAVAMSISMAAPQARR